VRFLDAQFTHAGKDVLFLSASVPEEFDTGGGTGVSGLRRAFGVVTKLAKQPELEDTLDKLFNEALQKGAMRWGYNDKPTEELLRALIADGYAVEDGKLVPADSLERELAQEINVLYRGRESVEKTNDSRLDSISLAEAELRGPTHDKIHYRGLAGERNLHPAPK
jgi:hypothetical protein